MKVYTNCVTYGTRNRTGVEGGMNGEWRSGDGRGGWAWDSKTVREGEKSNQEGWVESEKHL